MKTFKDSLILITRNGMGEGDKELGTKLITNYLKLLSEEEEAPKFIAFYNSGVRMICSGSTALEPLKTMESKGVKLLACKTCLNHFELLNEVQVGTAGTMMDIIELQKMADKVITL